MAEQSIRVGVALHQTRNDVAGLPVFIAGSSVAAEFWGKPYAWHDIDLFTHEQGYFATIAHLNARGYQPMDRFDRVWKRHLKFGFNSWHTNSMRLESPDGVEINVIYKRVDGQPTTKLSDVLESFDFGLLAMGIDAETDTFHDMRQYLFGHQVAQGELADLNHALPMLPYRSSTVGQGYMSQHIALRTFGRAQRYFDQYGYDGSKVVPDLVNGYRVLAEYKLNRTKPEDIQLGHLFTMVADNLDAGEWDKLKEASDLIPVSDELDAVMEALE